MGWTQDRLRTIKETVISRPQQQTAWSSENFRDPLVVLLGSHCTCAPVTVNACWWVEGKWGLPSVALISFPFYIIDQLIKDSAKGPLCVVGQCQLWKRHMPGFLKRMGGQGDEVYRGLSEEARFEADFGKWLGFGPGVGCEQEQQLEEPEELRDNGSSLWYLPGMGQRLSATPGASHALCISR